MTNHKISMKYNIEFWGNGSKINLLFLLSPNHCSKNTQRNKSSKNWNPNITNTTKLGGKVFPWTSSYAWVRTNHRPLENCHAVNICAEKKQKEELRNTHKYSPKRSRCPFVKAAKTERLTHSGGKCLPGPLSMDWKGRRAVPFEFSELMS